MTYLTDTEEKVVKRIGDGRSVEEIANDLCMSPHTVRFHIRIVAAKIGGEGKPLVRILRWHFTQRTAA